jgi:hypothetical protein
MMGRYILKLPAALVELSVEELTAAVAPTPGPARLVGDTNRTQDHEIGVLPERRNDLAGMHPDNPLTHRGLDPFGIRTSSWNQNDGMKPGALQSSPHGVGVHHGVTANRAGGVGQALRHQDLAGRALDAHYDRPPAGHCAACRCRFTPRAKQHRQPCCFSRIRLCVIVTKMIR